MDLTNFLLIAAETEEKSFSLFDFSNNVLNWVVLVGLVIWIWNKVTPNMFQSRHENIERELREADKQRIEAEKFLADQQTRVANAEAEAGKILQEARHLAQELKTQMQEQTVKEIEEMRVKLENAVVNERQMAVNEMRQAAAKASIELTKQILPSLMTEPVKNKMLNQFIEQLDEAAQSSTWLDSKN
jgi:F-type H+-transporting ATPase subunit b